MARISLDHGGLPYRGTFGSARPPELRDLPLPPAPMPSRQGTRPLKAWRYVGVYGDELMLCAATVRIGRARQAFWAVWDRAGRHLYERTALGAPTMVVLEPGRLRIVDGRVQADVTLEETAGVEAICPTGASYAWTRKQGGIRARGRVMIAGLPRPLDARAVIDDTAAYYQRHTRWSWSAGVGLIDDGRSLAWNLVSGVNDPEQASERTVWIDGEPIEPPPCTFAEDLSRVDALDFTAEAERERRENLLLVRSYYRQPFGTFSGELPGGVRLAEAYGVMEAHDVWW
jgi:Domain of unknown function (DUF2804), C-terminal